MTANELRIGNWVHRNGEPLLMDIDEMELLLGGRWFDELSPIPLNPEILEKCGFCRDSGFWNISYGFKLYDPLVRGGLGELVQNDTKIFAPMWNNHLLGFGIKHLHQLQNIHFALTGKELTVNLYDNDSE